MRNIIRGLLASSIALSVLMLPTFAQTARDNRMPAPILKLNPFAHETDEEEETPPADTMPGTPVVKSQPLKLPPQNAEMIQTYKSQLAQTTPNAPSDDDDKDQQVPVFGPLTTTPVTPAQTPTQSAQPQLDTQPQPTASNLAPPPAEAPAIHIQSDAPVQTMPAPTQPPQQTYQSAPQDTAPQSPPASVNTTPAPTPAAPPSPTPAANTESGGPVSVQPANPADASAPLQVGLSSKKVPAGTFLKISFNSNLDSKITEPGEPFTAMLTDDFSTQDSQGLTKLILPAGTMVRGRVEQVRRPGFFSRGGSIYLLFDHVVDTSGDQLPLDLKLSTVNTQVNQQGALYTDPGIPTKLRRSVDRGVGVLKGLTQKGVEAGKDTADGLGQIITVPIAAIGGAVAGTAVTAGHSAASIVGKGDSVVIRPGDTVTIDFGGAFNLPVQ